MKLRFQVSGFRSAFTLIELLLAILIGVLVVVLLTSILATTARTTQGQSERAKGEPAAMDAMDQLRDDLTRAILPDNDAGCAMSLKPEPAVFGLCTLRLSETVADPQWSKTWRVEYRTEPDEAGGIRIVRIEQPAIGPGALDGAVTGLVIGAIDRFAVELYDGAEWHKEWPLEDGSSRPVAARIEISAERFKGRKKWETEIFIPAGLVVTSSVIRTAPGR
ncbi:MAG TPA: hypothetical protein VIH35_02700 [Kiritimatiellia bacterium]